MTGRGDWRNSSEEKRLRCRATETRGGRIVQCMGHSRVPHEHENRGKKFGPNFQMPTQGTPTVGPSPVRL